MIEEVKATLAIEGLELTAEETRLLKDFRDGNITIDDLKQILANLIKERKAA